MTSLWQNAAALAARAHQGQTRRDGQTPYTAHCFRVAMTVRDVFGCDDEVVIAAALLHDAIEDTGIDYDDLHDAFGPEVADLVAAMTKNMALPEHIREPAYDQQLAAADWRARLIKLADVYDNQCDTDDDRRPRMVEKARRAVALAKADAAQRPSIRAGIEAVEALLRKGA